MARRLQFFIFVTVGGVPTDMESWMMENHLQNKTDKTSSDSEYMNWDDVRNIARRVIRAANLAVMVHGELDTFTDTEEKISEEKLTG